MREIKFRAWDKKSKKMRQVTEIVFNTGFYLEPNDNTVKLIWVKGQDIINDKDIQLQRDDGFILMQYTGLKDKNGKEIYEGDIVTIHKHNYDFGFKQDEIGQIKFIDGAFGFYREKNEKEYFFNDLATENGYGELDYYEVIGNIYDNPELLKEE